MDFDWVGYPLTFRNNPCHFYHLENHGHDKEDHDKSEMGRINEYGKTRREDDLRKIFEHPEDACQNNHSKQKNPYIRCEY